MPKKPAVSLSSLLDNDFYKFTMQYAVIKLFPEAKARYTFINRGRHRFPEGFAEALRDSVNALGQLKLTMTEKRFLEESCPYLDPTYLDFLQGYCYNPDEVTIEQTGDQVEIYVEGYWYRTILWEVPLMSLISEVYYHLNELQPAGDLEIIGNVKHKIDSYAALDVTVAEFGTRRRQSYHTHRIVAEALKKYAGHTYVGSSNVHMAMATRTKPIGTHAHEWFMFHAARYGFKMANAMALENWVQVFRGDLGIALSDTYTSEVFFRQFDKKFAKLFDGVRHDSGDPVEFAERTIRHYTELGIDPRSKTIIFSDALNYAKVERIAAYCRGKIGMSFGIGTNFTNDVGLKPLNMVIKMIQTRPENDEWTDVIKLSDELEKHTGTPELIRLAKSVLGIS